MCVGWFSGHFVKIEGKNKVIITHYKAYAERVILLGLEAPTKTEFLLTGGQLETSLLYFQ